MAAAAALVMTAVVLTDAWLNIYRPTNGVWFIAFRRPWLAIDWYDRYVWAAPGVLKYKSVIPRVTVRFMLRTEVMPFEPIWMQN